MEEDSAAKNNLDSAVADNSPIRVIRSHEKTQNLLEARMSNSNPPREFPEVHGNARIHFSGAVLTDSPAEESRGPDGIVRRKSAKRPLNTEEHSNAEADVKRMAGSPTPVHAPTPVPQELKQARAVLQELKKVESDLLEREKRAAQKEKELSEKENKLQTDFDLLQKRTETAEKEAARLSNELAQQARSVSLIMKKMEDSEKMAAAKEISIRTVVRGLVRDQAERIYRDARERTLRQSLDLGRTCIERHGTSLVEGWIEGDAFLKIRRRLEEISRDKESIDKTRKQLNRKRNDKKDADEMPAPNVTIAKSGGVNVIVAEQDTNVMDEIYKSRLAALKKEENDLNAEQEKLEVDKLMYIREIKRQRDEDSSRFGSHPLLHDRYVLMDLLGKGGFSEVYRAFDLSEMKTVACKIHELNSSWTNERKANYTKHALREYEIHKRMHHPNIVQLYDVFEIDQNSFCTVLELCEGGDLDQLLKLRKTLPEKETRSIILQMFSGLKYLNEQPQHIIHYDLKPGNILFLDGSCSEIKITDFGLSKVVGDDAGSEGIDLTSPGAGTYWYLPPETFELDKSEAPKISPKVDVWSAGVIMYQMLYGKRPFGHGMSQQRLLSENIILNATKVEFPPKPTVSKEAKANASVIVYPPSRRDSQQRMKPQTYSVKARYRPTQHQYNGP